MKQVQHPHKIPVVDDEPDVEPLVLQRMRRNIRSGQYRFVFARNGVEALQRLRQETDIDMVLSDINMPQMDGLTLLEQIPKVDPNVRCVIVSAYGDMENIRTANEPGSLRLRHQAARLQRSESHHRPDAAAGTIPRSWCAPTAAPSCCR